MLARTILGEQKWQHRKLKDESCALDKYSTSICFEYHQLATWYKRNTESQSLIHSCNSPIEFAQRSIRCSYESQLIFVTNIANYDLQERSGCVVHANFSVLQRLQIGKNSMLWLCESVRTKLFITFQETVYQVMSKTHNMGVGNVNHLVVYHSRNQLSPRQSQSF